MRIAILGRDGVINEIVKDGVRQPKDWCAIPGSLRAVARLTAAHVHLFVVTNQPGIADGKLDSGMLARIHAKMNDEIAREGGRIEAILYCPHSLDDGCMCRKPKPGLLLELSRRLEIDLRDIPFIGDSVDDIRTARAVGARPMLVRTGSGRESERCRSEVSGIEIFDDLAAIVPVLIEQEVFV